jgi:hypothetical protein
MSYGKSGHPQLSKTKAVCTDGLVPWLLLAIVALRVLSAKSVVTPRKLEVHSLLQRHKFNDNFDFVHVLASLVRPQIVIVQI